MRVIVALLFAASLFGAWNAWRGRAFVPAEGVLASTTPLQQDLDTPKSFEARGVTLNERARYDLTVRILRKERYRIDGGASIAPWDLAVGWGPMSDSRVIDSLEITQSGRFFYWRPRDPATFPVAIHDVMVNAAQIHAIPADDAVEARLAALRPGQVVALHGFLVDVRGRNGFRWNTSLTREDTGDGACEIMWIESIDDA
ncbi:MAG TPA: hypothetical protein VN789_09565 [Casimicrobiaceae bacterium]|nr:hypothetical protein [Casimicrobiaceae bacterium]